MDVVLEQGGTQSGPLGPNPKGIATRDANGNVTTILFRADLSKVASNNRMTRTPEEAKTLATGMARDLRQVSISDADGNVTLKIEASGFPNLERRRTEADHHRCG